MNLLEFIEIFRGNTPLGESRRDKANKFIEEVLREIPPNALVYAKNLYKEEPVELIAFANKNKIYICKAIDNDIFEMISLKTLNIIEIRLQKSMRTTDISSLYVKFKGGFSFTLDSEQDTNNTWMRQWAQDIIEIYKYLTDIEP